LRVEFSFGHLGWRSHSALCISHPPQHSIPDELPTASRGVSLIVGVANGAGAIDYRYGPVRLELLHLDLHHFRRVAMADEAEGVAILVSLGVKVAHEVVDDLSVRRLNWDGWLRGLNRDRGCLAAANGEEEGDGYEESFHLKPRPQTTSITLMISPVLFSRIWMVMFCCSSRTPNKGFGAGR
jgi:hypothetical protein